MQRHYFWHNENQMIEILTQTILFKKTFFKFLSNIRKNIA